jgi:hypothetical protein
VPEAIRVTWPHATVQTCVVHLVRPLSTVNQTFPFLLCVVCCGQLVVLMGVVVVIWVPFWAV